MQRTRVKICGLTRPADVDCAVGAGADALGFVFYPPSARALALEQAAELMQRVVGQCLDDGWRRGDHIGTDQGGLGIAPRSSARMEEREPP